MHENKLDVECKLKAFLIQKHVNVMSDCYVVIGKNRPCLSVFKPCSLLTISWRIHTQIYVNIKVYAYNLIIRYVLEDIKRKHYCLSWILFHNTVHAFITHMCSINYNTPTIRPKHKPDYHVPKPNSSLRIRQRATLLLK